MYSYCVCTVFSGFWLLDSGFLCLPSRLRVPGKTYSCATQIVEFTLIPKINDAFVRPLYWVEDERELLETPPKAMIQHHHPHPPTAMPPSWTLHPLSRREQTNKPSTRTSSSNTLHISGTFTAYFYKSHTPNANTITYTYKTKRHQKKKYIYIYTHLHYILHTIP